MVPGEFISGFYPSSGYTQCYLIVGTNPTSSTDRGTVITLLGGTFMLVQPIRSANLTDLNLWSKCGADAILCSSEDA